MGKQVNKDGDVMDGYRKPIQDTNKANPQLMSRPIAKKTKSYCKKKMKNALGNVPSISIYFLKSNPTKNTSSSYYSDDEEDEEIDSGKEENVDNTEDTAYYEMIDSRVQKYQETWKIAQGPAD